MKLIVILICLIYIFPFIILGEQVEEMSTLIYKNKFGSFTSGGYTESLNYRSINYIGQGFESIKSEGPDTPASYDGYSGAAYFPMIDLFYNWSSVNHDLTVNWRDFGNEYNILLTTSKDETNIIPKDDPRTINLNSEVNQHTFADVPDSKYLYFHIQAKPRIEGGATVPWTKEVTHHKVKSKQMLVLKYYEEDFLTFNVLNKGTWRKQGDWRINSSPVTGEFYLTNSGVGVEKFYIEKNTPTWKKYEYIINLKKENSGDANNVALIFKMQDINHYYMFKILTAKAEINKYLNGVPELIKDKNLSIDLTELKEFKIRIRYDDSSGFSYLQVYEGDNKIFDILHGFPIYGGIGLETDDCKIIVEKIIIKPIN